MLFWVCNNNTRKERIVKHTKIRKMFNVSLEDMNVDGDGFSHGYDEEEEYNENVDENGKPIQ